MTKIKFPPATRTKQSTVKQRFAIPKPSRQHYKSEGIPRFGVPDGDLVESLVYENNTDPLDPNYWYTIDKQSSRVGSEFTPSIDCAVTRIIIPKMAVSLSVPASNFRMNIYDITSNLVGPDGNGYYDFGSSIGQSDAYDPATLPNLPTTAEQEFIFPTSVPILASGKYFAAIEFETPGAVTLNSREVRFHMQLAAVNASFKGALYQNDFSAWDYSEANDELLMSIYGEA